jgi:hypothetical protein
MVNRVLAVALLLIFLCFNTAGTSLAQTAPVGVNKGNTFTYDVKGLWSSSNSSLTPGENMLQLNETEYFKVAITDISGSDVSMHTTWAFRNGTDVETDSHINVATGSYDYYFWAIFPANLNVGDMIHPYGMDKITVNGTDTRYYNSSSRETNRFLVTGEFASTDNASRRTYSDYMTVHFDKQTGMLVEIYDFKTYTNPEYTETTIWEMIDTNAFDNSGFPMTIMAIPVIVAVVLILIVVFTRRNRPKRRR